MEYGYIMRINYGINEMIGCQSGPVAMSCGCEKASEDILEAHISSR
jgi:hypothetical protein